MEVANLASQTGALSPDEIERFRRDGFLVCPTVADAAEMDRVRAALDRVLATEGFSGQPTAHRHLDSRDVYELVARSAIVDRVASLLGPDILLWHTRFFDKPPGDGIVPWHQDMAFWPLEPAICISVWIAIDRADRENGCLEVLPGSHMTRVPHVKSRDTGRFARKLDPAAFDESRKVAIELEPGGFVIFDRWLVHGSPANNSSRRRLGLAARLIPTSVAVDFSALKPQFPELAAQVVRGADRHGLNRMVEPSIRSV